MRKDMHGVMGRKCVCVGVKLRECGTREGIKKRIGNRGVKNWNKEKTECLEREAPLLRHLLHGVGHCYPLGPLLSPWATVFPSNSHCYPLQ